LDLAGDAETAAALRRALPRLLDQPVRTLRDRHLDKDFFNNLLVADPVRELLCWLDHGEAFKAQCGPDTWATLGALWKTRLGLDPDKEGLLGVAGRLASRDGPWAEVWKRFAETPGSYSGIPALLRRCKLPQGDLFKNPVEPKLDSWPQWNESQENTLRSALKGLTNLPAPKARKQVLELNKAHELRQSSVWARLGEAPLALALEGLARVAQGTAKSVVGSTEAEFSAHYGDWGWKVDDAALAAVAATTKDEDRSAVRDALGAVYLPWVEASARNLQDLVQRHGYPGGRTVNAPGPVRSDSCCLVFVDGLRFDAARRLVTRLEAAGCEVEAAPRWAALPSVTATGKPAVTPVAHRFQGTDDGEGFEPVLNHDDGFTAAGVALRRVLMDAGWTVLEKSDSGTGNGLAWCEAGDLDSEGHASGAALAGRLDSILDGLSDRVCKLKAAGWKSVRVVTDHGWLLMPGGLPKVDLPAALTEFKWGRCAQVKAGSLTDERCYPWYWNEAVSFALADGASCYRAGTEYAHGGLSLQECLVLDLEIRGGAEQHGEVASIDHLKWKGLRCTVSASGRFEGLRVDVRLHPGDPASGLAENQNKVREDGTVSVVVGDDAHLGKTATVVLLDDDDRLMAQQETKVGGE
jgi:hypothetical protein